MDNGSEFKAEFNDLCNNMGLVPHRSNTWNPQSNSILERIHQVLADGLRAFELDGAEIDPEDDDPFDKYISSVSYAIRSSYHQTHGHSPAQLVFGRDMFLDAQCEIDWDEIKQRKQNKVRKSNEEENRGRINHTYQRGDKILIKRPGLVRTLALPFEGPYKVVKHGRNGSIKYEKSLNNYETVNIRRVFPFYEKQTDGNNSVNDA